MLTVVVIAIASETPRLHWLAIVLSKREVGDGLKRVTSPIAERWREDHHGNWRR